jgi:lipopolysaccharide transport system ATP-binding protein
VTARAIVVSDLEVSYPVAARAGLASLFRAQPGEAHKVALDGVSFVVHEGERVGIVGPNGAGKSTLLRAICGILPPSRGTIALSGSVAPLFEFATGFEMERSGLDNIRIRGLLQGMSWAEINRRMPEIAAFSELGPALRQPVRTYSSGMFVRLAFATATAIDPEILLIDEAFGAGDQYFAGKATRRMHELIDRGRILMFTSHNLSLVAQLCSRVLWLAAGRIVADGPAEPVLARYAAEA